MPSLLCMLASGYPSAILLQQGQCPSIRRLRGGGFNLVVSLPLESANLQTNTLVYSYPVHHRADKVSLHNMPRHPFLLYKEGRGVTGTRVDTRLSRLQDSPHYVWGRRVGIWRGGGRGGITVRSYKQISIYWWAWKCGFRSNFTVHVNKSSLVATFSSLTWLPLNTWF